MSFLGRRGTREEEKSLCYSNGIRGGEGANRDGWEGSWDVEDCKNGVEMGFPICVSDSVYRPSVDYTLILMSPNPLQCPDPIIESTETSEATCRHERACLHQKGSTWDTPKAKVDRRRFMDSLLCRSYAIDK
ncbi:hypothetical protein L596_017914 [Steinernema carpocapsae]|uniref:Uncharacterized protein n=1 Tax=Steinernema carpocapsae TaxID=34508 RepID=A0A4V6A213_STECR|nr:hypothetical protein L596_017914 [Steinernema carpocapsae]